MAVDLILKNGLIADGTGADAYRGDVAIAGGRIAGVGRVNGRETSLWSVAQASSLISALRVVFRAL